MRKLFLTLLALLSVASFGLLIPNKVSAQDVNSFYIQDFQMDMYLGKDSEGRSTLATKESITAVFSELDINHGLERAIPKSYDGHPTSLRITSVTDQLGMSRKYSTYESNGNEVLRIGDANTYMHGEQTFVISYTQRDVTRYFSDARIDEFYWDTNGTEWKVPIRNLAVRLHLTEDIARATNGQSACYEGLSGSASTCQLTETTDGFSVQATDLLTYESITLAIGFKAQTFAPYKKSMAEKLVEYWAIASGVTGALSVALIFWLAARAYQKSNRTKELDVIVPQYLPPKDVSVSAAASIGRKQTKVFAAQIVDLAVRHYLKIYQTREKSFFRQAQFELEIIKDISSLKQEEQELLRDIFDTTTVGSRLDMSKLRNNNAVARRIMDNTSKLNKDITGAYGMRARDESEFVWFKRAARNIFFLSVITLSPWLAGTALMSVIIAYTLKPLTDKGLELARYLKGLDMYIKLAETDRLQMLQSPTGAAKARASIDVNDTRQMIKLYERVLPYAILFGSEKEWNKVLGHYYETTNTAPIWYAGTGGFNPASFTTAISSFNASASSTSSGSSGGGSSGGGGGGGGGGGW